MTALTEIGTRAQAAARHLGVADSEAKNQGLQAIAAALAAQQAYILAENQKDLERGRCKGLSPALLDRLSLNETRLAAMGEGLAQVWALSDPVGEELAAWTAAAGIRIRKVRVPLGVIGIIYEARPNVTVDAAALCLKAGNAVILRGSSSALASNQALVQTMQEALAQSGLPAAAIQLVVDAGRDSVLELLKLKQYIDVIIPRGGADLINHVVQHSLIPVLETGAGNCHAYVDAAADAELARRIVVNAKVQRPSVCNAIETLLVHKDYGTEKLKDLLQALQAEGVALRGCDRIRALFPAAQAASAADWSTEFLDYVLAVKVVDSLAEAIDHINRYGTRHSEVIITECRESAQRFMSLVDAAALYHNASTRFTDGFEFGLGAEIGISTQKLHARGPMGLQELTSYKFLISGEGQIRS